MSDISDPLFFYIRNKEKTKTLRIEKRKPVFFLGKGVSDLFGDFVPYLNSVMDYSSVNRKVIANNIANYNTPDYKVKTASFENAMDSGDDIELETTNKLHISNKKNSKDPLNYEVVETSDGSSRVDGNNVDQTAEMIKMLKNNALYTTSVNALNKEFSLTKIAIGN
ncbi:flagellar basal body rod protein FlgB [Bacillus mexicanus]|uniref:flagellar basal body rod protein FlgB n=1 Tax=Bacillus mexicanus TaxID=2834415 RepID=UPI003D2083DF